MMTGDKLVEKAKNCLQGALLKFLNDDLPYYGNSSKNVSERCVSARIGHYMANCIESCEDPNELNVDCEYNRMIDKTKIYNKCKEKKLLIDQAKCDYTNTSEYYEINEYIHKEFNCEQSCSMTVSNPCDEIKIIPDIIIHKRRCMKYNILVCEIKPYDYKKYYFDQYKPINRTDCLSFIYDRLRLKILTKNTGDFEYKLGAFVMFDQNSNSIHVEYFKDGSQINDTWHHQETRKP